MKAELTMEYPKHRKAVIGTYVPADLLKRPFYYASYKKAKREFDKKNEK